MKCRTPSCRNAGPGYCLDCVNRALRDRNASLAATPAPKKKKPAKPSPFPYLIDDAAWSVIAPHLPEQRSNHRRRDDRVTMSAIVYVLRAGLRWKDCPKVYGAYTTAFARLRMWQNESWWPVMLAALRDDGDLDVASTLDHDRSVAKATRPRHRHLTEDQVRTIRQAADWGASITRLAAEHGVNYMTVWEIAHRKTWKHVADLPA